MKAADAKLLEIKGYVAGRKSFKVELLLDLSKAIEELELTGTDENMIMAQEARMVKKWVENMA